MNQKMPKATHEGVIEIGEAKIPCAVLEDGTRLLTQSGFMRALGRARQAKGRAYYDADVNMPAFLTAKNLKPFITKELMVTSSQIDFRTLRGIKAYGYPAELLPEVCEVFLKARDADVLTGGQEHIAVKADILVRGLAHIGITALVDEATGYQEVRDRLALQKILEKYIARELLPWTKRFPDEFYQLMFKLKDWQYRPLTIKRPQVVGKYTNDIVYERLETGVLDELRKKNPKDEKGRRKVRHHQWLTPDIGHPKLRDHLNGVIALMKAASNWETFKRLLNRAFPKKGHTLELPFEDQYRS